MLKKQRMVFYDKETGEKLQTMFTVWPSEEEEAKLGPAMSAWLEEQMLRAKQVAEDSGFVYLEIEPWVYVYEYGEDMRAIRRVKEGESQLWTPEGWVTE